MPSQRNDPLLLLWVTLLLLGYAVMTSGAPAENHTGTWVSPGQTPGQEILDDEEDYDNLVTDPLNDQHGTHPAPTQSGDPRFCNYDRCQEGQPPCAMMAAASGCLCPGLSGPQQPPEAPYLTGLVQEGSQVDARWCAPPSTVSRYQVTLDGRVSLVLGEQKRSAELRLAPGTRVCVQAVNNAGVSPPGKHSCSTYKTPSGGGVALRTGLIVGGLSLLLLLSVLAVLLWKRKACRKAWGQGTT